MSLVGALQDVLAGEHAAVYAYSVVGGVLDPGSGSGQLARDAYDEHRARRDRADELLRALDVEPLPAEPGYALPAPVASPGDAAVLARRVEDRCAVLYAALVAATTADQRELAAAWLEDAATRALVWGAPPTAFPGVGLA
jgi:hypothetical protein